MKTTHYICLVPIWVRQCLLDSSENRICHIDSSQYMWHTQTNFVRSPKIFFRYHNSYVVPFYITMDCSAVRSCIHFILYYNFLTNLLSQWKWKQSQIRTNEYGVMKGKVCQSRSKDVSKMKWFAQLAKYIPFLFLN